MRTLYNIGFILALITPVAASGADKPTIPIIAVSDLPACLRQAEQQPARGELAALDWESHGGGNEARLCQAMALFHQGQFEPAAEKLDALVANLAPNDSARTAHLQAQAGWAWLRAGNNAAAEADYTAALGRLPDDTELRVDRAFARASAHHYAMAIEDLSAVLQKSPDRSDVLLYRAEAYRALDNFDGALGDVAHVLKLTPENPEALLLRGNIHAQSGDTAAAAADWTKVAGITPPESEPGQAAADNLRRLNKTMEPVGKDK